MNEPAAKNITQINTAQQNTSTAELITAMTKKEKRALRKANRPAATKRKPKKGLIIFLIIAVLIAGFIVYSIIKGNNAVMPVTTEAVTTGDIEVVVSLGGTVSSAETRIYYSDITAPIASLPYKTGERVNAGDIIYAFDEESLNLMKQQAELNITQADGNYSGTIAKNAKATAARSGASMTDIQARLDQITAETDMLNTLINEKTARMNRTLTDLQKTAMDVDQNNISDSTDASEGNTDPITRKTEDGHQMSLELQQAISEVQYALTYDPEIIGWKDQINSLNEEKAKLQEQSAAEQSALTSGEYSALEAQKDLTELESNNTLENISRVENGIRADFSGVITEIAAEEGATVQKGSKILTIASTDDVVVDIQISKSDLERIRTGQRVDVTIGGETYEGEVTQIAGAAVKNANGVAVVNARITVLNPGDSIILGVEATNKIHTDKAVNVLTLTYEYIGTDAAGDYVYMVENGVLIRRDIVIGLSNTTEAEVTEGLRPGDRIVTTDFDTLTEGIAVMDIGTPNSDK